MKNRRRSTLASPGASGPGRQMTNAVRGDVAGLPGASRQTRMYRVFVVAQAAGPDGMTTAEVMAALPDLGVREASATLARLFERGSLSRALAHKGTDGRQPYRYFVVPGAAGPAASKRLAMQEVRRRSLPRDDSVCLGVLPACAQMWDAFLGIGVAARRKTRSGTARR